MQNKIRLKNILKNLNQTKINNLFKNSLLIKKDKKNLINSKFKLFKKKANYKKIKFKKLII